MKKLDRILEPIIHRHQNPEIQKELIQIYPAKDGKQLYEAYIKKKLRAVFLILLIGIVAAAGFYLCSRMEGRLTEGAQLLRNEWGAGDYEVALCAKTGDWSREISLAVEKRKLSEEEKNSLMERLYLELPELIKKDNQDLNHIAGDLELPVFVEGFPFRILWSVEGEGIEANGAVDRTGILESEKITLIAEVSYEGEKTAFSYEAVLLPEQPDAEERWFRRLRETLVKMTDSTMEEKVITLPKEVGGKKIEWEEVKSDQSLLLLLLAVACSVFVWKGKDYDLKKSCDRRSRQLFMDYAGFVGKLRLYISAGLTVRNAFTRIAADYGKFENRKNFYLYQEMKTACHQLENGMMEEQVYREFGKRCGEMKYRKLSFLLAVHLKQGNGQLLAVLEQEEDSARQERRDFAKKAGEEAGTKLLLPMMLMLVEVMLLILLPAYFDFGSI